MSDRGPQSFSQNTRLSGTSQDIQFLFNECFWDYVFMTLQFLIFLATSAGGSFATFAVKSF